MQRSEMMAGIAEQFMSNWTSSVFRERCVAQIELVRSETNPQADSADPIEKFLAQKTSKQLEEFIFEKSQSREDYVSLVAEMLLMLRQHEGSHLVVGAAAGATPDIVDEVKGEDAAQEEK